MQMQHGRGGVFVAVVGFSLPVGVTLKQKGLYMAEVAIVTATATRFTDVVLRFNAPCRFSELTDKQKSSAR